MSDSIKQYLKTVEEAYQSGVAPEVWDFYIGGYQVLDKWLKDRRGRKLSYQDLSTTKKLWLPCKKPSG